jgi:hypothetical protein
LCFTHGGLRDGLKRGKEKRKKEITFSENHLNIYGK